jgi:cyclopropane fatty-acyl-phospholipid synthase-like methyltransferase
MTTWLHQQRLDAAHAAVQGSGARTVLDLVCGQGDLLTRLVAEPQIERIVGVDTPRFARLFSRAARDAAVRKLDPGRSHPWFDH